MNSPTAIYLTAAVVILPIPFLAQELNGIRIVVSVPFFFNAVPLSLASLSLALLSKRYDLRVGAPAALATGWCAGIVALASPVVAWFLNSARLAWIVACQAAIIVIGAFSLCGLGIVVLSRFRREGRHPLPAGAIMGGLMILAYLLGIGGLNTYSELSETQSAGLVAIIAGARQFALLTCLAAALVGGGAYWGGKAQRV